MISRNLALFFLCVTALVYGVTYTVAKDVMAGYVEPSGFILVRVFLAGVLFWITGFFTPKQRIDIADIPRLISAGLFGASLNMLSFYKGIQLTSPISAAVIMVNTPLLVLLFSAFLLKEKIEFKRAFGIFLGVVGAVILITMGSNSEGITTSSNWGNFYILLNAIFYGLYLIIVKKLMDKYHPFTLIKWMYLVGFICVLPFGWQEAIAVDWLHLPQSILLKIGFVIIFTTYLNYSLILKAMKALKPTTVSAFIYLQPLIATFFAVSSGKDTLDWIKVSSAILIFSGVYLVSLKSDKTQV